MAVEKAVVKQKMTIFQMEGITCLDCAQKFEQAVSKMPGVTKASLDTIAGKLTVEGQSDLAGIRRLGMEEHYTIRPDVMQSTQTRQQLSKKPDWELRRAILSGVSLAIGYSLEKFGGPVGFFLPVYVVAVVLGGWGNFRRATRALPHGNFNMSVLMSVAVVGAMAIGQYEEAASVAFLFAISEMLESWTMEKARRSIRELMDIAPKVARVRRGKKCNRHAG